MAHLRDTSVPALFYAGEYSKCLIRTLVADDDDSFVLRMRCLIRLRRSHEILDNAMLERVNRLSGITRLCAYTLVATAAFRCAHDDLAERYFREAYRLAREFHDASDEVLELRYFDAIRSWASRNFAHLEKLLEPLLESSHWHCLALELRSWIKAANGDFRGQLDLLMAALDLKPVDVWHRASIVHVASELARELSDESAFERLSEETEKVPWTNDLRVKRVYAYSNLGWSAATYGQVLRGNEFFCDALDVAGNDSLLKLVAVCDKASIAHDMREPQTAAKNFAIASNYVKKVRWHEMDSDRIVLTYVCDVALRIGEDQLANLAWKTYNELQAPITPIESFGTGDPRKRATERYTQACIDRKKGHHRRAVAAFQDAFEIWKAIGYAPRAALAAIDLAALTNKRTYYEYALEQTERFFPNAWFAQRLHPYRERVRHPELKTFSATKQAILLGIVAGKRDKEIAAEIGIADTTVRRRLQELFDHYSVLPRNRRALALMLKERGIH